MFLKKILLGLFVSAMACMPLTSELVASEPVKADTQELAWRGWGGFGLGYGWGSYGYGYPYYSSYGYGGCGYGCCGCGYGNYGYGYGGCCY